MNGLDSWGPKIVGKIFQSHQHIQGGSPTSYKWNYNPPKKPYKNRYIKPNKNTPTYRGPPPGNSTDVTGFSDPSSYYCISQKRHPTASRRDFQTTKISWVAFSRASGSYPATLNFLSFNNVLDSLTRRTLATLQSIAPKNPHVPKHHRIPFDVPGLALRMAIVDFFEPLSLSGWPYMTSRDRVLKRQTCPEATCPKMIEVSQATQPDLNRPRQIRSFTRYFFATKPLTRWAFRNPVINWVN